MKIDPEAFITRHLDQIVPRITTQSPLNQVIGTGAGSGLRSECPQGSLKKQVEMKCGFGPLGCQ